MCIVGKSSLAASLTDSLMWRFRFNWRKPCGSFSNDGAGRGGIEKCDLKVILGFRI